jgi:hypothetical protein
MRMPAMHTLPVEARSLEATYQIKVQGTLDTRWSEWFGGLAVTAEAAGDCPPLTILAGAVPDQAALRGILNRLWDLNLILISVNRLSAGPR